ncbi:hypothetical protein [Allomuricauda sp. SCSIO 65647]|uniref:hypothetical protein n=1 Tax=Allomuricauda sp. SCSIO 65647 TaxID=2908843 RepID=UPI001F41B3F4|nr:hypothetical protein [Muricauda sp. SCSIO 65647]UJH68416.1 hypothetical protein L0P89_04215 [Muricauda sp. SCSIO 65647]
MNRRFLLAVLLVFLSFSCEEEEDLENLVEAQFFASFLNNGANNCNEAGLTFNFLITYPDGDQESFDLAPTEEADRSLGLVSDGESINVKIFFPSSEEAIAEANIPFIFNGVSDEELEPSGNELMVFYCHSLTNGIRWDIFY